ncbi:hypothetical protein FB451DRAFT_1403920 [Mycena latifolia]|nr:hypothetical protein FB451DRAFT_1403920 [Mycena latifolia]
MIELNVVAVDVEIVDLYLRNGTHNSLLITFTPQTEYDNAFSSPAICGTLLSVGLTSQQERYLIIDWKMQTFFIVSGDQVSLIALIPGHLILNTGTDGGNKHLYLIPADDAMHRPPPSPEGIKVMAATHGTHSQGKFSRDVGGAVQCFPASTFKSPHRGARRSVAVARAYPRCRRCCIGTSLTLATPRQILSPGVIDVRGEVDLMDCGDLVDVAPHSGALTYATDRHIVILYFR